MKTLNYTHLDASKLSGVVDGLKQLLADNQVFYSNLRGFHWNVTGRRFFVLHSKLEEMYDSVADQVDELAERILMLGQAPENRFSEYLKVSAIKEVATVSCEDEIIKNVLESLSVIIAQERKVLEIASEASDEVTVSLMSDYLKEQEKLVWMLTAYCKEECK